MPSSSTAGCSTLANEPDERSGYDIPIEERFAAACAAQGADASQADLVDAAGGAVFAGISRNSREGRKLHCAVHQSAAGVRSHLATHRSLSLGRGPFVFPHPDASACHE